MFGLALPSVSPGQSGVLLDLTCDSLCWVAARLMCSSMRPLWALPMTTADKDREYKIGARARRLWRAVGAPKDRLSEFMELARGLMSIEEHPTAVLLPNPMTQRNKEIPDAAAP